MGEPRRIRTTWLEVRHLFLIIKLFTIFVLSLPDLLICICCFTFHRCQTWGWYSRSSCTHLSCEELVSRPRLRVWNQNWAPTFCNWMDRDGPCWPAIDVGAHHQLIETQVCCHLWQTWQSTIDNSQSGMRKPSATSSRRYVVSSFDDLSTTLFCWGSAVRAVRFASRLCWKLGC